MVRNMCKPKLWTQEVIFIQEDQALKEFVQKLGTKEMENSIKAF